MDKKILPAGKHAQNMQKKNGFKGIPTPAGRGRVPTSSGQSKNRAKSKITGDPPRADASHAARFSGLRGKPSIRKRDFPDASIALRRRPTVTSAGTILPSLDVDGNVAFRFREWPVGGGGGMGVFGLLVVGVGINHLSGHAEYIWVPRGLLQTHYNLMLLSFSWPLAITAILYLHKCALSVCVPVRALPVCHDMVVSGISGRMWGLG